MIVPDEKFPALLVLGLVSLMTSCQSAPSRLYSLEPVAAAAVVPYAGPALRVDAVHVPPAMDRVEILTTAAPGELKINDFDHWAAPLGRLVRQTLTDDLIARLPKGRVIFPHLEKTPDAIGIDVDILAFSADTRGARLEASWTVTSGKSNPHPAERSVSLLNEAPTTGAPATARALSAMLAQLADRISDDLISAPN
jgi:hypothetical protein